EEGDARADDLGVVVLARHPVDVDEIEAARLGRFDEPVLLSSRARRLRGHAIRRFGFAGDREDGKERQMAGATHASPYRAATAGASGIAWNSIGSWARHGSRHGRRASYSGRRSLMIAATPRCPVRCASAMASRCHITASENCPVSAATIAIVSSSS